MTDKLAGLVFVLLSAVFLGLVSAYLRARPQIGFRVLRGVDPLINAVRKAVEDGTRAHVLLGSASLTTPQSASALAGLGVWNRILRISSTCDRPPVASSGDGALAVLSSDAMRESAKALNAPELYDRSRAQLAGTTPFSYTAGAIAEMQTDKVSANIMVGNFGPEIGLLLESSDREGEVSVAASDSLSGQAVIYAAAGEALIGEEVFALPAYLGEGNLRQAGLVVQDILRWVVIVVMIIGSAAKAAGLPFL